MELQSFLQLLGENLPFAMFVGVLALLVLACFILFMNSLGSRSAQVAATLEANAYFVEELQQVSQNAQQVISQLSEIAGARDQEIREKTEQITRLEQQADALRDAITQLEIEAHPPFSFKALMLGMLVGFFVSVSAFGIAYYLGLVTLDFLSK